MTTKLAQTKIFRDSVHGYINVPKIIVEKIIDSELFQRLRHIEQTGMRVLYPAARHDRFIHSLGVYHLGAQAFQCFKKNVTEKARTNNDADLKELVEKTKWWEKYDFLFSLACLLHDCAHAPFSHTYEFIYDIPKSSNIQDLELDKLQLGRTIDSLSLLNHELLLIYSSETFKYDFLIENDDSDDVINPGKGAPHEKLSAIMVYKEYFSAITEILQEALAENITQDDIEFIGRAILGCKYIKEKGIEFSIKNCFIAMLNSNAVDVDGLDYIVRDAYNSGMDSWSIDYKRIIESFTLTEISVLNGVEIEKSLTLDGIWLQGSRFVSDEWLNGKLTGKFGISKIENNDMAFIEFVSDEKPFKDETNHVIIAKEKVTAKITHGTRKFDLNLSVSCKLSGEYKGIITGKYLGRLPDDLAHDKEYELAFNKTCISVIQSAIDARNHEYLWVYSHPKVIYGSTFLQCHLLRLSAKFLCCKKNNVDFNKEKLNFSKCKDCEKNHESEEEIILHILGFDSFIKKDNCPNLFEKQGYRFYRSTDEDLNCLFKNIFRENTELLENRSEEINEYFNSYFSRQHKKPIWKSFIEYVHFFNPYTPSQLKDILSLSKKLTSSDSAYKTTYGFIVEDLQTSFEEFGIKNTVLVKSRLKTKELDPYSTFLTFNNSSVRLCDIMDDSIIKSKFEKDFFYIYGDILSNIEYTEIPKIVASIKAATEKKNKNSSK